MEAQSIVSIAVKEFIRDTGSSGKINNTKAVIVQEKDDLFDLTKYQIADSDETGTIKYYGFLRSDGHWYIMANDTTNNTYKYCFGSTSYGTKWSTKDKLDYDYLHNIR